MNYLDRYLKDEIKALRASIAAEQETTKVLRNYIDTTINEGCAQRVLKEAGYPIDFDDCEYDGANLITADTGDKEDELRLAVKISDAVQSLVGRLSVTPAFVIAKGGITSSDVGTKALAVKKANASIQLIYDYHRHVVYAVNETLEPVSFKATMKLLKGKEELQETQTVTVAPATVVKVFGVDVSDVPASFLFLKASDEFGKEISANAYFLPTEKDTYDWEKSSWVHTPITKYASYAMLEEMTVNTCQFSVNSKAVSSGKMYEVTVTNPADKVAFMVRLTAKNSTGQLFCPVYWSDNYLIMAPGETRTITCWLPTVQKTDVVEFQIE